MGENSLDFWFAFKSPLRIGGLSTMPTLTLSLTHIWSIQPNGTIVEVVRTVWQDINYRKNDTYIVNNNAINENK
jgi:hypothetical protein